MKDKKIIRECVCCTDKRPTDEDGLCEHCNATWLMVNGFKQKESHLSYLSEIMRYGENNVLSDVDEARIHTLKWCMGLVNSRPYYSSDGE